MKKNKLLLVLIYCIHFFFGFLSLTGFLISDLFKAFHLPGKFLILIFAIIIELLIIIFKNNYFLLFKNYYIIKSLFITYVIVLFVSYNSFKVKLIYLLIYLFTMIYILMISKRNMKN